MTSKELVSKYRKIYKGKTGLDISEQDAYDQAMKLVTLVDAVYKPISNKI